MEIAGYGALEMYFNFQFQSALVCPFLIVCIIGAQYVPGIIFPSRHKSKFLIGSIRFSPFSNILH